MRSKKIASVVWGLVCTFSLGLGCGINKEVHQKVVAERDRLRGELKTANRLSMQQKQRITELEADLDKVKQSMSSQLATLRNDLQSKIDEIRRHKQALKELDRIKAEMAHKESLNKRLLRQFRRLISAGKLRIVNRNGRLVIQMASKVLFRSGKAKLRGAGKRQLDQIARILKKIDRHFQVAGHTDNIPMRGANDNWALSAQRATVVVRLLEKSGVPGKNLSAAGFSQYNPMKSNATPKGRADNRRIEITLLPAIPQIR